MKRGDQPTFGKVQPITSYHMIKDGKEPTVTPQEPSYPASARQGLWYTEKGAKARAMVALSAKTCFQVSLFVCFDEMPVCNNDVFICLFLD